MAVTNNKRALIEKARSSQFVIIIVASVIVSASLIGIKILWNQRSYQAEIIDAKTDARDQLKDNIAAVEQLKPAFDELEKSEVNSTLVLDALPSKYDYPALVTSIEKMAIASGVNLDSFVGDDLTASAVNSQGQPVPVAIPFSVNISGSYDDIKKFIANMQLSIRPFEVEEMSIESAGEDMQATIKFSTYYMPAKSLEIRKESISSSGTAAPAAGTTTQPTAGTDPAAAAGVPTPSAAGVTQ